MKGNKKRLKSCEMAVLRNCTVPKGDAFMTDALAIEERKIRKAMAARMSEKMSPGEEYTVRFDTEIDVDVLLVKLRCRAVMKKGV